MNIIKQISFWDSDDTLSESIVLSCHMSCPVYSAVLRIYCHGKHL